METEKAVEGGLLKPQEAAARMQVSVDWLLRYCRRHKPAWFRKLGHRTARIEREGFAAFLSGRRGR